MINLLMAAFGFPQEEIAKRPPVEISVKCIDPDDKKTRYKC